MSVVGEERKRTILEKVEFKGKVKVSELAREFAVSTETIRRYLEELDREKKLKKVYGGAVQLPGAGIEAPMLEREMLHIEEKKRIGYKQQRLWKMEMLLRLMMEVHHFKWCHILFIVKI